jgi:L-ascorbate metabolism protein UlaG (beta-lactamase superfamily)
MRIKWMGHACFLVSGQEGSLLTDPYGEAVPYLPLDVEVDVVTVSHDHFDHNAVGRVRGDPIVVRGLGRRAAGRFVVEGIGSFHDAEGGATRGQNTIFVFEVDGITLAHLGDLGGSLDGAALSALRRADVLFIPVGGTYTLDADQAAALLARLPNVKIAVPMHYWTDRLTDRFPIAKVDNFARKVQNARTVGGSEVTLTRASLPASQEVWIFDYA